MYAVHTTRLPGVMNFLALTSGLSDGYMISIAAMVILYNYRLGWVVLSDKQSCHNVEDLAKSQFDLL